MRTARPAGQRPGRFQQSCGLLESARVPVEPGWRNEGSAPSPSGRDHASRGRSHSPRGEVAKNAPQEHFLHTPADGAPKKRLAGKQGVFLLSSLRESCTRCAIGDENSTSGRSASRPVPTVLRTVGKCAGPGGARMEEWEQCAIPLRGGIMHRAGARIRLAGKSLNTLRRSVFFTRPLAHQKKPYGNVRLFLFYGLFGCIRPEPQDAPAAPVRNGDKNRSRCWSPGGR